MSGGDYVPLKQVTLQMSTQPVTSESLSLETASLFAGPVNAFTG
jgi:hypothetical protein